MFSEFQKLYQFRLSEIKLDIDFGISEIENITGNIGRQGIGRQECRKTTGHRNVQRRCGSTSSKACPIRESPRQSIQDSAPAIPAMPRSAAPGGWVFQIPSGPR